MNTTSEIMLHDQIKEANSQALLKLIRSLDEKINRLRESYKANQTQIREAESKSESANEFESLQKRDTEITRMVARLYGKLESYQIFQNEICNSLGPISSERRLKSKEGKALENLIATQFSELTTQIGTLEAEQKQILVPLTVSRDAVNFSAVLDTLRNREREIAEEGTRLKEEQQTLYSKIEELKSSNFSHNQTNEPETQIIIVKKEFSCKVGSQCLRLTEFLFSSKTCKEVFYPIVGDWREDYINALRKGKIFNAIFISVRNYSSFAYTLIVCSRFGKLIDFIMKIADVIEFFNKFSK